MKSLPIFVKGRFCKKSNNIIFGIIGLNQLERWFVNAKSGS